MKRVFAVSGLFTALVGTPLILTTLGGGPSVPSFDGVNLSSQYMPLDPVLKVLALLAWAVWGYLALAVALRAACHITSARRLPGRGALVTASGAVIPQPLRRMIDFAIGGALVAVTITGRSLAADAPPKTAVVVVSTSPPADTGSSARAPKPTEARSYEVRAGDSLWRIAERELGSGFKWREIYALNQGTQFADGRRLNNPRLIYPGWTLRLPVGAKGPTTPREARSHESSQRPETRPSLRLIEKPSRNQVVPESPVTHPTLQRDSEVHAARPDPPSKPILTLPNGAMIATSFGCGVLAAEMLGRLRRRRARRLDEPVGDLSELESHEPKVVRELRHAGATPTASRLDVAMEALVDVWRSQRNDLPHVLAVVEEERQVAAYLAVPEGPLPSRTGGRIGPAVVFERADGLVRATISGPFPPQLRRRMTPVELGMLVPLGARRGVSVHAATLGLSCISIEGSDALATVRQMLLALASETSPEDLSLFLIGDSDGVLDRLPHVARAATWDEAGDVLNEVQGELIRRARLLAEADDDHWGSHAEELPALVMVTSPPPSSMQGIVEAIGFEASRLGSAIFALGWRPERARLHMLVEQTLHLDTDLPLPRELQPFLLDETRCIEVVQVIIESREAVPETQPTESEPAVVIPMTREQEGTGAAVEQQEQFPVLRPTQQASLEVRCLGHFEVARDGEVVTDGWRKKSRELLAYLVAHEDGAAKDKVVEALWPGDDVQRGYRLFDLAASFLRTQVRQENTLRYVEKVGDSFRLEPKAWRIDAWEFTRLVEDGLQNEDVTSAENSLRTAIGLYRGEFCDDTYFEWAEPVRERYRSLFIRACGRLTDILTSSNRPDEALGILDRATEVDSLCEDLWRRAMLAEIALGRSAAALERYTRLKNILAKELEIEPDPATQRIARDIEVSLRRKAVVSQS